MSFGGEAGTGRLALSGPGKRGPQALPFGTPQDEVCGAVETCPPKAYIYFPEDAPGAGDPGISCLSGLSPSPGPSPGWFSREQAMPPVCTALSPKSGHRVAVCRDGAWTGRLDVHTCGHTSPPPWWDCQGRKGEVGTGSGPGLGAQTPPAPRSCVEPQESNISNSNLPSAQVCFSRQESEIYFI